MKDKKEDRRTTVICTIILRKEDAKDFREELRDWLMGHRMGLDHIDIEEKR